MTKAYIILVLILGVEVANAKYLRFWRGHIKSDIAYSQFQKGLSEIFVPMTAKLAESPAKLISYHPVLFSEKTYISSALPAEIALVEYADEQSYRSFRETPEGQNYSNAHWDYFERTTSRSAVAEKYLGELNFDKSYWSAVNEQIELSRSNSFIKVYSREQNVNDELWLDGIKKHIQRMQEKSPDALVFLVDKNYLMEFSFWTSAQDQFDPLFESVSSLIFNHYIQRGSELLPDQGLKF